MHPHDPNQPQQPHPGYGQPQQSHPGWTPPPPKKSNVGKVVGFGCGGALVALALFGGCAALIAGGDDSSSESSKDKPAATAGKGSGEKPKDAAEGADTDKAGWDDVKITGCQVDSALSWASADVEITNNSSKTSNYMVQVEFVDAGGTRLDEGFAASNNLAPEQTTKETAQGTKQVEGKVTCKITDVTRYAS